MLGLLSGSHSIRLALHYRQVCAPHPKNESGRRRKGERIVGVRYKYIVAKFYASVRRYIKVHHLKYHESFPIGTHKYDNNVFG